MAKKLDPYTREIREDDSSQTIKAKKIQLRGTVQTPVTFMSDTNAVLTSNAGPFDFSGVGTGGTVIINPNGGGAQTVTIDATAGKSESGTSPSTDISAETDFSLMISVDGDTSELVTLTNAGKTTGALIATELQTKIRALGGRKANVTVAYGSSKYTITSSRLGTSSHVVVSNAASGNICEELKLGASNGGTETAGTGDVANLSSVTATELATVINADTTALTASVSSGALVLTSDTAGRTSSLVLGNGTLNTALGFTNSQANYGAQGMGYDSNAEDANYLVSALINGTAGASLGSKGLSVTNKTAEGFYLECETAAATDYIDIVTIGL